MGARIYFLPPLFFLWGASEMLKNKKLLFSTVCLSIIFIFFTISRNFDLADQKSIQKTPPPTSTNKPVYNYFTLNNICDCYDNGFQILDDAISLRQKYSTFEEYSGNKESVSIMDTYKDKFQKLQLQCVEKYKDLMIRKDHPCGKRDDIYAKRQILSKLGISI